MASPNAAISSALAIAALLAGCGASGSSDIPPAKAAYIEEADAVCSRQTRKIERLMQPYTKGRGLSELGPAEARVAVRRALAPALRYEVRSVRILVLPPRYVQRVLRFLSVWQHAVEEAERNPVAFVHAEAPFAEDESLARQFGFKVCGSLRLR